MKLRLPGKHDPLTLSEQADLERQLTKKLDSPLPTGNWFRMELENVARLYATLDFYKRILGESKDLSSLDAALPERVTVNGIDYIEDEKS